MGTVIHPGEVRVLLRLDQVYLTAVAVAQPKKPAPKPPAKGR
jgi:hypothetical protein